MASAVEKVAKQVAEQRAYIERHFPSNDAAEMQSGVSIGNIEALLAVNAGLLATIKKHEERLSQCAARGERAKPTTAAPRPVEGRVMAGSNPRVVDNDRDEITVTLDGKELRGWSYESEAERRVKMLAAREFCEGWFQAMERTATNNAAA